jgi:uncharacterized CHY-type Zn-finger protein
MKYIFKQVDDISGHNAETTIEFSADTLSTILEHFEMFIRGCGFYPPGNLEFVDYEDPYTTPKFECAEENYEDDDVEDDEDEESGDSIKCISCDKFVSMLELMDHGRCPYCHEEENTHSEVMDWTASQLIRPPKMHDICSVCKIDNETMLNHDCWDKKCPKGKNGNQG